MAPIAQDVHEQRQGRRRMTPARIVEVIAWKIRAPVTQDLHQAPCLNLWQHLIFRRVGYTKPVQGRA
jgi:hypothetical protein